MLNFLELFQLIIFLNDSIRIVLTHTDFRLPLVKTLLTTSIIRNFFHRWTFKHIVFERTFVCRNIISSDPSWESLRIHYIWSIWRRTQAMSCVISSIIKIDISRNTFLGWKLTCFSNNTIWLAFASYTSFTSLRR